VDIQRLLVFVEVLPRHMPEGLGRMLLFGTTKFRVPIFGELLIEAKDAEFVDQKLKVIPPDELKTRLYKYFGKLGEDIAHKSVYSETDLINEIEKTDDPLSAPLEGFWVRVTGKITCIEGLDCEEREEDSALPPGQRRINGIEQPNVHLQAKLIEFEVDPLGGNEDLLDLDEDEPGSGR